MPASRPLSLPAASPTDDGLFGPDSVTWRVMAAPGTAVAVGAAVLVQMLHPRVIRLIDQASTFYRNPELRGQLTGQYVQTITYGDTAAAETAGAALRRLHRHMKAIDPVTREEYAADEPELLLWVHNATVWPLLRACARFGPALTPPEQDRFVSEQRVAARLVGIDPATAPATVEELDAAMERMRPQLAFTLEAAKMRDLIVPRARPVGTEAVLGRVLQLAAVDLLTPEQRELYGFRWSRVRHAAVQVGSAIVVGGAKAKLPYDKALPQIRAQVSAHAFGAKALRINKDLRDDPS